MRRPLAALLTFVLVLAGCSLGPREDWAALTRAGFEIAKNEAPTRVRQSVAVAVIETTIRQEPAPLIAKSEGIADFKNHRARLVETGSKRRSQVIYDDLLVYVQRSKSSIGTSKQRWALFDYEREPRVELDDNDRRLSVGAGLISPVLAVEMLDGVLTGSFEEHGTETRAGVQTTQYSARLAPDAAISEIRDEDRKEGVERLFATLAIQEDDFPVDVWLDPQGRVVAVRYVMRQQKDRVNAFGLSLYWEFLGPPKKATRIDLPDDGETLRSGRFSEFVEEVIREF